MTRHLMTQGKLLWRGLRMCWTGLSSYQDGCQQVKSFSITQAGDNTYYHIGGSLMISQNKCRNMFADQHKVKIAATNKLQFSSITLRISSRWFWCLLCLYYAQVGSDWGDIVAGDQGRSNFTIFAPETLKYLGSLMLKQLITSWQN